MVTRILTPANFRLLIGSAVIIYETVFTQLDRPWLLVIAAGLMGYSVPKRLDKALNGGGDNE